MNKIVKYFILGLVAMCMLTSCNKEQTVKVVTASTKAVTTPLTETTTTITTTTPATTTTSETTTLVTTPEETTADQTVATVLTTPEATTAEVITTTEETTTVATTEEITTTTVAETVSSFDYPLSDSYNAFLKDCTFVGDSICSGLKAYEILPSRQVCAVGNVAARNIFEDWVEFKCSGSTLPLCASLKALQPKNIIFSMGMNDVNMTSKEQFCANYDKIIEKVSTVCPSAKLYIFSITPITYRDDGKIFTYNSTIDEFNKALKKHLAEAGTATYIDVNSGLKNSNGLLSSKYLGSPDGVHLTPGAYTVMLNQFCEQALG